MRGTIRRHGPSWQALWKVDGKQRSKSGFTTKKEAEDFLVKTLSTLQDGSYVDPARVLVREYLTDVWLPAVKATIRPTTFTSYAGHVRVHLIPHIGHVRLQGLTAAHLNTMYGTLSTSGKASRQKPPEDAKVKPPPPTGLSAATIRRIHGTLHRSLADGMKWGYVSRNVASSADPPRSSRPELHVWTGTELHTFLEAVRDDRQFALWRLLATTGARRGETLGLKWRDVDVGAARIRIRHTLVADGYALTESEPKTARGRRTVALDGETVEALKVWRKQQAEEMRTWQEAGVKWPRSGYVFTLESGEPLHPGTVSARFNSIVHQTGLPSIRLHDLRHGVATMLLASGISPRTVSDRLGHSSTAFTMDVYGHVLPGAQEDAAATVSALITPLSDADSDRRVTKG